MTTKQIKSKRNKIKDLKTTRVGLVLLGHGQCSWCITSDDEVKNVVLAYRTARYMRRSWKGIYSFKKEAIIFTDTSAKSEPTTNNKNKSIFSLPKGAKIEILDKDGDWLKVKNEGNLKGWIKCENFRYL